MNKELLKEAVKWLINKAAVAEHSSDALKFSQAAVNAANAVACMKLWPKD